MPEDKEKPDYISTVYTNLKSAYGDNFQRTEEDFRDKMSKDFEYRKTVHKNLQSAYGDDFKKDFNTFNFQLPSIPRPNQPAPQPGVSDINIEDVARTQDYSKGKVDVQKIQDNMAADNFQPSPSGGHKIKQANTYKDIENWTRINAQKKSSDEQLTEQDPEILKRSIDINSKVSAKLFLGQNVGKDAENFGKYLMHVSSENPEKYEELVTKIGMYGHTLTEKEKFDLKNEANNYVGGKINQDQQIFKARGYDKKFEQYAGISKKFKAIENEINSYGDIASIPEDKKVALKTKIDDLNKQKEDFESNPDNMTAVDKYAGLHDKYDDYLKAQNKILQDSPSMLKKQLEMDKLHLQEKGIESGKYTPGSENYLTNEVAGNIYNTVIDAAENVISLTKDLSDKALNVVGLNKGYSPNDRLFDGLKSLVDANIKATVSNTDMFDNNGNLRAYRILPNVAKVATDMAIQLAPVGRLAKLGETAKISSSVADNVAIMSSNFMTQYGNYKQEGIAQGLSDKDAEMYGLAQGIANSVLQLVSPNKEIRGVVPKEKLFDMVKTYAEQGAGAFTKKEAFNKMLSEITDMTFAGVKEITKENIQEDLESIAEKAINSAFNASNKNYKLPETVTPKELKENLILTTIVTGGAHAGSMKKTQSSIVDGATLGLLDNYDESMKILSDMKESGKISDSDYDRVSQQLESTKEIYDKIPDNFSEATKHNLMPLLREKAVLEERGKRVDPTLRLQDAKKLDDIDKTLSAYYEKETSEPTAKPAEQKATPTEQENKEGQKQIVPLSDEEISKLSNGAEVMIMDEGSLVKATINDIKDNGETLIDLPGGKRKIVLNKNFVKEQQQEKTDIGAELSPEHLASLQKQDVTQTPEQQLSKGEKATQVWAVAVKNRLGKVFKGTDVAFTQQEFDDAASRSEHPNAINANAFVDRGTNKIYLNPKKFKKDTPIHEFGHIWTDVLKDASPEVYEKILQTARTSDFYKQTKANPNYSHLSDNDIAEEAFVQALGKKGVDVFNDIADRNVFHQRVSDMWNTLKSSLGVDEKITVNDDTTFEELVGKAAEELGKQKISKKAVPNEEDGFSFETPSLVEKAGMHKEMTEDDKGNYIFYHYSSKELKKIDPSKFGSNTMATGRDENPGIGISMYYTRPDRAESNVPDDYGHIVRIPKNKVYPIDSDPLNFYDEAKKLFEKEHPGQAFDTNKQAGYISKIAAKNGFPMTVAKWNIGKTKALRAQTTEPLKAEKYSKKEGWSVKFASEEVENFKPNATRKDKKNLKFQIEETTPKQENKGVEEVSKIAKEYAEKNNITGYLVPERLKSVNEDRAKNIADAFSAMKHEPENPKVKAAYKKLSEETISQGNFIIDKGYKIEIFEGEKEPYKNSAEMLRDVAENKHMYILSTSKEFGDTPITEEQKSSNPLLSDSGIKDINGKPLLVNDVFRFVHDFFGHAKLGNQFGAIGEETAWNVHSKMFSEEAQKAMTTETRGQNSFVNFGPHMRNKEGKIIKKGEEGYLEPTERPFAEQKIGLLPEWATQQSDYDNSLTPEEQKVSDDLEKDFIENYEARKAEYIAKNGLVFDTDKAREFSPAYQKNPELLSNATQIPARNFVSRMYAEELAKPAPEGKVNAVLFTAGGSGVGKSKTVANLDLDQQLTVDTNLSNFERGVNDIQQALDAGKQVEIVFTYRDPKEAFVSKEGGVVERAKREGRTVPYDVATTINEKSLSTIIKLSEHFKGDNRVQFAYFNNSFSKGYAQPITLDDVKEIKPDFKKAKEEIKNEIDRQYKSGELEGGKFDANTLYAGLTGDTGTIKRVLGEMAQKSPGSMAEGSKQAGFQFEPESDAGKELTNFIKGRLEAGIPEEKVRQYLKENKLSDKFIDDAVKSATEKPRETPKEPAENVQKNEPVQESQTAKKTEQPKVEQKVEANGKIIDISRVPVEKRINTVLGRVFNNPEAPQTLIDALTKRFGSREQMLKSKRLSQAEARELGAEIVKAFDNLNDAIEFATSKGYELDGDIQAAILDNVISAAYDAEKKATTDADREYYQNIQTKALDEIAYAGEQSGRRISYYQMMYNVNPQIFGSKMYDAIRTMQDAVLNKKIGDSYKNADEKISSFAKESKDAVNKEKEKAASKQTTEYKGPKYQGPKTNKSQSEIDAIRNARNAKMEEIKKKFKGDTKGPNEKFSFEKPESTPIDQNKVNAIKDIGDTFIDEGYLTYAQWSRKVENEFKNAGITVYGKELQEAWNKSNDKVSSAIKEAYKNLPAQEVQSLIEAQSKAKVQELPLAIKSILADSQVSKDMKDKIKDRLMNELGLSSGYAQHITDSFMKEFETQAKKQVSSKLKEITNKSLISTFKKPKKEVEARIVNDIVSGTFEGAELKPSFYEMYGMEDASKNTGLKDKLVEMAQRAATQQQGSLMKDKALRDLYNEIQKHKPLSKWQIGTDVYYSSLLSGYETHIKNFVLYNALQTYVNKPLQIAFQNMMSGNKSKAASSIFSKELAKFMYNEAKGIVLTGTNSFYDKPKTESEMETFTKSGGKNPLKSLWRYAKLPTRFLAAEDAFGTLGLSEMKARQLMYDKIKHEAEKEGEKVDPEQINQEVNKALGWTKSSIEAAKINAEQSLKNYYGENFNLKEELTKKPTNKEEKIWQRLKEHLKTEQRKETIKSEYKREVYRSMLKGRDAEITQKAMDWAKTALLQNEPEGSLGRVYVGMQALINQLPVLRAFVPFLKVPLNVANNLIHTTPGLSLIRMATKRKGIFGGTKMTKEEIQEHKQKAITYTALTAALMALQGFEDEEGKPFFYVTGKNGQNYSEAIAREQAGKGEPYTVYVGGVPILKYQYTPWMPLFTTLGIANDMRLENNGSLNEEAYTNVMTNAFLKYASTINEQAALKGVNEVINTVQDFYNDFYKGKGDAESRLNDFVTKKVAGITKTLLVPNAATQANTDIKALFDADRIASTSFMDDIIKDMPIIDVVSQQFFGNESKIDVLGRPIKEKFSVAGYDKEFPESIGLKTASQDPYYKLFVDKHYLPFAYNKRALKVEIEDENGEAKTSSTPLSPKQRYDANLMRGKLLYDYITENMESLKEMTDKEFESDIKAQIKIFDQQTEQELFPQE